MPFNRPTLQTLVVRNQGDIESNLPGTDAKVRRSNLNILGKLIAGVAHGIYGYIARAAKQILPFEAEAEELDRHANFWLAQPRKPATPAQGSVPILGTNGRGIPAGTVLIRADGVEYATDAEVTIAAGTATAAITAVVDGAAGNAIAGTTLTLASPIAGVNGNVTVPVGGLTQGADVETDDALRVRVLARPKQPPHGGAQFDYVNWALEVPGVTRAWCYPLEQGDGTVTVRFVRDNDASVIPDAAEVAAVQAYIEARYPVTGHVFAVAPIAAPIDFVFTTITPATQAVKDAVAAELADLINRESEPGGTILITHIRAAISIAAGEENYVLTSPIADVNHAAGYMATMGNITWP
ncbi:tail protein [Sulfurimicrobium lacus]|uniref:Tail protein n=1 Tax=Sulfurimicrobium lacus TaxID=2715678 RepID=A0A6F8V9Z7_9PROT|nr:baseplate J/gp47 family protein [Sulfurimicrobium lacus]BCB26484.1 tail protein [Sulfurimicrobium lacus]